MHVPRVVSAVAAAAALVVAGCGSSGDPAGLTADGAAKPQPRAAGPLQVTRTDGRLGSATTADQAGLRLLPIGPRVIDGTAVRRRAERNGVGAGASCPDQELLPTGDTLARIEASALCLVNGERADAGLPPLAVNAKLVQASAAHSRDMVARQFFAHESPDGRTVVDRTRASGYITPGSGWTVGENLAWGSGSLATPKSIVAAWMDSPGHRENILRAEFKEAGLAVVTGNPRSTDGSGGTYTMTYGALDGAGAGDDSAGQTVASTAPTRSSSAAKKKRKLRKSRKARRAKNSSRKARRAAARRAAARRS